MNAATLGNSQYQHFDRYFDSQLRDGQFESFNFHALITWHGLYVGSQQAEAFICTVFRSSVLSIFFSQVFLFLSEC